jgi:hypothetical protein
LTLDSFTGSADITAVEDVMVMTVSVAKVGETDMVSVSVLVSASRS